MSANQQVIEILTRYGISATETPSGKVMVTLPDGFAPPEGDSQDEELVRDVYRQMKERKPAPSSVKSIMQRRPY